ncbi:hypothetical protein PSTT_08869 [Puccinia striiformis]|uniref:Uncharacterized protein n=1 Tax=Puccinia striiformis TaxID=27350 RepID=A0A2S4VAN8_9BASI|nr:hypothetical protein PSTT_08869 [Puccinia striiformis]
MFYLLASYSSWPPCCKQSVADMPHCGPGFEHGCTNKNLGIHDTGTIIVNPNYCYDGQDPVCCPIGMLSNVPIPSEPAFKNGCGSS